MKDNTGALHCQVPVDVATFLLNEKRDDIAKIEVRHKVSLVLIPNRHLETPQHEIVRLRHDQLNQEDQPPAQLPDGHQAGRANYTPPSANTDRPARQEAAVKGITPGQPAPVVEPKAAPAPAPDAREPARPAGPHLRLLPGEKQPAPRPVRGRARSPAPRIPRPRNERRRRDGGRDGRRGKRKSEANAASAEGLGKPSKRRP